MRRRQFRERTRSYSRRKVAVRELIERFLIVCEGEKTEPNYFGSFRVPKDVLDVRGLGDNTLRLVEKAIRLKNDGDYDQIWCVFDRDSFPAKNFNAAFDAARDNNIQVAYSNEAFELWYLLHFHFYDAAISRKSYITRLSELLGHKYEKNSETIYDELLPRQIEAIRNCRRLLGSYNPPRPEQDNPSSNVHLLVEQLNKYVR